jgi:hypothetical protein
MKKKKRIVQIPYKVLRIDGDFVDFNSFYEENKKLIYDSIYETFLGFLKKDEDKKLILQVQASISEIPWETEFVFVEEDSIILKRDLMPFYEKNEDYEMCTKIKELNKVFTNSQ